VAAAEDEPQPEPAVETEPDPEIVADAEATAEEPEVTPQPVTDAVPPAPVEQAVPQEQPAETSEPPMHLALVPPPAFPPNSEVRIDGAFVAEPPDFSSGESEGPYTDLILDARGLGFTPSPGAQVVLTSGKRIYPFKGGVLEDYAPAREPIKMFVKNEAEARRLRGIGSNPLVIEVDAVTGVDGTDLVLSRSSARKLSALRDSRLMQGRGYVVIVVD